MERALGVFEGALSPAPAANPAPAAAPAAAPIAAAAAAPAPAAPTGGGGGCVPRLASAPPPELRGSSGSSPAPDARPNPGSAQLPEGWGDRHTEVSADELMRRGIIAPDEPLGDLK